jgi:hypothetical protein
MITSGVTIGIHKQDGTHMNIAIDPAYANAGKGNAINAGTYKLYRDIDSPKTFDKGYLGALLLDGTDNADGIDNGYQYSGSDELTDFELKQLAEFIRNYHATGKEFDDHKRDISTK